MRSQIVRSLSLTGILLTTVISTIEIGCVDSMCRQDSDCNDGQVCVQAEAVCAEPECSTHDQCNAGLVCKDSFCEEGCRTSDECGESLSCYNNRCVAVDGECACPMAAEFCAEDLNGSGSSSGEICVTDSFTGGVGLFFGSLICSHCRDIFWALLELKTGLELEGEHPEIIFVQSASALIDPTDIAPLIGSIDAAVIQSTDEQNIWHAYGAQQYDLIIVDSNGCAATHFENLTVAAVHGSVGREIEEVWRTAMSGHCP